MPLRLALSGLQLEHLVHRLIQIALQVEAIQHGPLELLAAGGAVGLPHVHRDALDLAQQLPGQALEEAVQGLLGAVLADPEHLGRAA